MTKIEKLVNEAWNSKTVTRKDLELIAATPNNCYEDVFGGCETVGDILDVCLTLREDEEVEN